MKIKNAKITLFIFLGLVVSSFAFLVFADDASQNTQNIFLDSDQDGLSNAEEKIYGTDPSKTDTDGDGYADGAEVKSGYNPLKPAPGDKIIQSNSFSADSNSTSVEPKATATQTASEEKINLTEKLSTDVAALMNQKSEENQPVNVEDLDGILSQMSSPDVVTFADLPEIDSKIIKIKKQNYSKLNETDRIAKEKEDSLQYFTTISYILANNSPKKISDPNDLQTLSTEIISQTSLLSSTFFSDTSYFDTLADKGQLILDQLKDVEVPEKLSDIHIKAMQLANYAIGLKGIEMVSLEDPIASMKNLSSVQNVISLGLEMSQKIDSQLKDLGITEIPVDL
jgi:hypothetical protein